MIAVVEAFVCVGLVVRTRGGKSTRIDAWRESSVTSPRLKLPEP